MNIPLTKCASQIRSCGFGSCKPSGLWLGNPTGGWRPILSSHCSYRSRLEKGKRNILTLFPRKSRRPHFGTQHVDGISICNIAVTTSLNNLESKLTLHHQLRSVSALHRTFMRTVNFRKERNNCQPSLFHRVNLSIHWGQYAKEHSLAKSDRRWIQLGFQA